MCKAVTVWRLGHRGAGASRSVPENTLASFDLCLKHGCDGFEFDVRRASDGTLLVCHDEFFRGSRVAHASPHELASWQRQGFLPTLEQVLQRYSSESFLDIELKESGVETRTLELLRQYPPQKGYVVTSFLPEVLTCLHGQDPKIELGFLWDQPSMLWRNLPVQWVLPERTLLDSKLAMALKGFGKRIGTWTVNDRSEMLRLAALGVEILISDDTGGLVNTFPVG